MMRLPKFRLGALLLASLLALPLHAETWRVDLILYRYLGPAGEQGQASRSAGYGNAIAIDDALRLRDAGITVLPAAEFGLDPEWSSLRSSSEFRPLVKLAWTQVNPPSDNGPRLLLRGGGTLQASADGRGGAPELREWDGSVGLNLSRFLHLDADLTYTQGGDEAQSWTLRERRRMRSGELHQLDSPRLGILARVSRVETR